MRVHVGTSGYNYPEWKGHFYPADLPAKKMFEFYAARFRTVEINYTFYRMPTVKMAESWRDQAPDGFTYTLKAPRRITHDKRLKDCADAVKMFCEAAEGLGHHRASLLFQLPPSLKCDMDRLNEALKHVSPGTRTAWEFRHDSWLNDEVYACLSAHGAALCIADFGDKTTPLKTTARHGYFRLRDEGYTPKDLERWASDVAAMAPQWDDAFVYFKHEEEGKGPEFAKLFVDALGRGHGEISLA
jgi:uncharacterized protein YecE (DUF72 family)